MAYVDEYFVAQYLNSTVEPSTGLRFEATPAEDESVDAEVSVYHNEVLLEDITLQVGGGYVCLNRYGYLQPGNAGSFYSRHEHTWGVQPEDLAKMLPAVQASLAAEPSTSRALSG